MTLTHTVSDPAPAISEGGALAEVREWLRSSAEPVPGARAAVDGADVTVVRTGRLGSPNSSFDVYSTVRHLTARNAVDGGERSLVAVLEGPLSASERMNKIRFQPDGTPCRESSVSMATMSLPVMITGA